MKYSYFYLFVFLAALLSACQSPMIPGLAAQPGEILFRDDFSDASGNWPQVSDPNGSLGIANGMYHIRVLSAHLDVLATPGHTFQDVQVETDATRLSGPVQNLFGLACRSSNPENFYFFAISSDGYFALGKIKTGKISLLGQEMMAPSAEIIQGDGPNHLRFDCFGNTLTGYANGRVIATGNDTDFTSGKAGLIAGTLDTSGVEIAFDNFLVYQP
jgi:hypothetical protein